MRYVSKEITFPLGTTASDRAIAVALDIRFPLIKGIAVKTITNGGDDNLRLGLSYPREGAALDLLPISILDAGVNSNPNNQFLDCGLKTDGEIKVILSNGITLTSELKIIVVFALDTF